MLYRVRCLRYGGRLVGVVLQQQNGPCPVIAIANVLSLRGHIDLHSPPPSQLHSPVPSNSSSSSPFPSRTSVLFSELIDLISTHLRCSVLSTVVSSHTPTAHEELILANSLANFDQVTALLPGLERGLDVNVRFSHATHFEYTAEIALFDLCQIRLLHGWVAEDGAVVALLKEKSFNEATLLVMSESTDRREEVEKVRRFLEDSASQLTAAGLRQLREVVREGELCVHFRNNHFGVLLKREGRLFSLCTDEGLVESAPLIAWVHITDTHGNDVMLNEQFLPPSAGNVNVGRRTPSPVPGPGPTHQPLPSTYLPALPPPVQGGRFPAQGGYAETHPPYTTAVASGSTQSQPYGYQQYGAAHAHAGGSLYAPPHHLSTSLPSQGWQYPHQPMPQPRVMTSARIHREEDDGSCSVM